MPKLKIGFGKASNAQDSGGGGAADAHALSGGIATTNAPGEQVGQEHPDPSRGAQNGVDAASVSSSGPTPSNLEAAPTKAAPSFLAAPAHHAAPSNGAATASAPAAAVENGGGSSSSAGRPKLSIKAGKQPAPPPQPQPQPQAPEPPVQPPAQHRAVSAQPPFASQHDLPMQQPSRRGVGLGAQRGPNANAKPAPPSKQRSGGGGGGVRQGGPSGPSGSSNKSADKFPDGGIADSKHQRQYRAPPGTQTAQRADVWKMCKALMDRLRKDRNRFRWFKEPVDTRQYPNYSLFVRKPMDFGTINEKLNNGEYNEPIEFVHDIDLVFDNCEAFNPSDTEVAQAGNELRLKFEHWWKNMNIEAAIKQANPEWRVEPRPDPAPLPKPDKHPNKSGKKKARQEPDIRTDSPDIDEVVDPELEGDVDNKRKRQEAQMEAKKPPSKKKKKQADANADAEAAGGARPARATGKRPHLPEDGNPGDMPADALQRPDGKKKGQKQVKTQIDHPDRPGGDAMQQMPQQQTMHQPAPQSTTQPQQHAPMGDKHDMGQADHAHPHMPGPGEGTNRDVPPGVRQNQVGKWLAEYRRGQFPRKWLGSFTYKEDAIRAYEERERELGHPSWRLGYGRIPGVCKKSSQGPSASSGPAMQPKAPKQKLYNYQPHYQPMHAPVSMDERVGLCHAAQELPFHRIAEMMDISESSVRGNDEGELDFLQISDEAARRMISFIDSIYPNWREKIPQAQRQQHQQQQQQQQQHRQMQFSGQQPNAFGGAQIDDVSSSSSSDSDDDDDDGQTSHLAQQQQQQQQQQPPPPMPLHPSEQNGSNEGQPQAVLPGQQPMQEQPPQESQPQLQQSVADHAQPVPPQAGGDATQQLHAVAPGHQQQQQQSDGSSSSESDSESD